MSVPDNVKILFVAGFGPIVRDTTVSRKLYGKTLGIAFGTREHGEHGGTRDRRDVS